MTLYSLECADVSLRICSLSLSQSSCQWAWWVNTVTQWPIFMVSQCIMTSIVQCCGLEQQPPFIW